MTDVSQVEIGRKETRVIHVFDVIFFNHKCDPIVYMSHPMPVLSAQKRKKHSKYNAPLHEEDDEAIDTVTHANIEVNTRTGRKQKRVKVPLVPRVDLSETVTQDPISFQFGNDWDSQNPEPVSRTKTQKVREKTEIQ
jgi:hypothetical protein